MKHLILSLFALGMFAACSPESADLKHTPAAQPEPAPLPQPAKPAIPVYPAIPPDETVWVNLDGGEGVMALNPKVDILFVIDNSGSMKATQENLSANINRFAESFQKNKVIDYHLGVTSVWDRTDKFVNSPKRKYNVGELRPVRGSGAKATGARYITRETGTPDVLAATLKIGIAGGDEATPEFEELFSPVLGAIKERGGHGDPNEGFFRDDAYLVVILVTDAEDTTTPVTPAQLVEEMVRFKGGNSKLVSAYGILVNKRTAEDKKDYDLRKGSKYHAECLLKDAVKPKGCTEGFGPDRLEAFIVAANSDRGSAEQIKQDFILELTSSKFGERLGRFGSEISEKALAKKIVLSQRPVEDKTTGDLMLKVRYGTQEAFESGKAQLIPQASDKEAGWVYDPADNALILSGKIVYAYEPGARIFIRMVPVTTANEKHN